MTKPKEKSENILREGINIIEENSRLERKVKEQQKEIEDLEQMNDNQFKQIQELKKEIDELMESIKNVLEVIDESRRVDALFELKKLYLLKRSK